MFGFRDWKFVMFFLKKVENEFSNFFFLEFSLEYLKTFEMSVSMNQNVSIHVK